MKATVKCSGNILDNIKCEFKHIIMIRFIKIYINMNMINTNRYVKDHIGQNPNPFLHLELSCTLKQIFCLKKNLLLKK